MYFFYLYFAHFVPNFGRCSISKLSFWRAFRRLFIVHTPPKPPLSINHHLVCISMCVCVTSHVLSSTHTHTLSRTPQIYTQKVDARRSATLSPNQSGGSLKIGRPRSRSKSPFRSFRWKRGASRVPNIADYSDDYGDDGGMN